MCNLFKSTLSTTITEATKKLLEVKSGDFITASPEALTDAQRECLAEYFHEMEYTDDEVATVKEYLLVNLTDDHLYVLEDGSYPEEPPMYHYEELVPDKPVRKILEVEVWFDFARHPLISMDIPDGYQCIGTDDDGNIIYRKKATMLFHSVAEAHRWADEQNRLAPPYRHITIA